MVGRILAIIQARMCTSASNLSPIQSDMERVEATFRLAEAIITFEMRVVEKRPPTFFHFLLSDILGTAEVQIELSVAHLKRCHLSTQVIDFPCIRSDS